MRDQEIIGLQEAYLEVCEEKDETEEGITGLPIPKKKMSPAKRHEFEKKRNAERKKRKDPRAGDSLSINRMTGSRGHGSTYSVPSRFKEEFVINYLLDEGFASDEKSAEAIMGAMSEAWVESIVEARIDSPTQDDLDAIKGMPLSHSARMKKNQKAIGDMKNMKGHGDMLKAARKHIEGR